MSHYYQSINQSINQSIMKNSVLILGVTFLFTVTSNAKDVIRKPLNLYQDIICSVKDGQEVIEKNKLEKPCIAKEELFQPETVVKSIPESIKEIIVQGDKITENKTSDDLEFMIYEESMREVITQSDLIIENTILDIVYPLFVEKTIYDEVAELELIIESTEKNENFPLDLKKINSNSMMIKALKSKEILGMN